MNTILVTSREGLYLTDVKKECVTRLLDGAFFGIARTDTRWYVFENRGNQYVPTNQGCILSFVLSHDTRVTDLRIEAEGLDNGSHQLMIYQNNLYVLETYVQRVRIYSILRDGTLSETRTVYLTQSTQPIVNAHYVPHIEGSTCELYLHANAITVQDGLIYVSCAHLRNAIDPEGRPDHVRSPHIIKVYNTITFDHLWDICLPNEYACHDVVFLGKSLYVTSPSDKVVEFDIVTKQTRTCISMGEHIGPRGLSIWTNGITVVGGRRTSALYVYRNNVYVKRISLPSNVKPCVVCHANLSTDFFHTNSPLRTPFVQQQKLEAMEAWMPSLQRIAELVFSSTWTERAHSKIVGKMYSNTKYTLQDVLSPPEKVFTHIANYQSTVLKKIALEYATNNENNDKTVIYDELLKPLCDFLQQQNIEVTGKLYLYPPQYHLGWHTNLEHQHHEKTFRCYTVFVTQENTTFFLYRHPISKRIHAIPDRNGYANIFNLRTASSPLWHAVVNPSSGTQRMSFGFAYSAHHPFARSKTWAAK